MTFPLIIPPPIGIRREGGWAAAQVGLFLAQVREGALRAKNSHHPPNF